MNDSILHPLTDTQRVFAAAHYHLVFGFLAGKRLDPDEYHDVVILEYLRAVEQYDERPELQKYSFSTIAYRAMWWKVLAYWRTNARHKRLAPTVSLDALEPERICEIGESARISEQTESRELWSRTKSYITKKQGNVLYLRSRGFTYREIAAQSGVKCKAVDNALYHLRKNVREKLAA